MLIRKFQPADAQTVCDLIRNTADHVMKFYETQESIDALKNERVPAKVLEKAKEREYIVVEYNWKIVGVGGIKDNEIRTMFVDYNHIKKWIWTEIIQELEKIAQNKWYKKVIVKGNAGVEEFYKKKGYIFVEKKAEKVGDTTYDVILMEKYLA